MPIVVNSNPAATTAAFNLSKNRVWLDYHRASELPNHRMMPEVWPLLTN